ncbi:MAG TPA: sugar ABC transporter substrate-binding protein [Reyranella sp.]|jgi:ribose transport system substrate-binding protein|nr:sugar ABC transporter substrate-binding protein [Reyranella sp.]
MRQGVPTLAVFTKNRFNPAYEAARLAADMVAREAGARTLHFVPEKADNIEQQKALVGEALKLRPDAVVFVPVDDVAMVPDLARFAAAGVPVVTCINRIEGTVVSHVGSDDVQVGRISARALFEGLGGQGTVVQIDGPMAAPTCRDRAQGVRQTLSEFPRIQLMGVDCGMNLRPEGRQAMERLLARHAEIDGVWCANDVMAYGALEALEAARRRAKVVGVNGLSEAIDNVEKGRMLATVDFSAFKIARFAAEAAVRHLRGERVPREIMVPTVLIDRSNVAQWKLPMERRPCPSWKELVG